MNYFKSLFSQICCSQIEDSSQGRRTSQRRITNFQITSSNNQRVDVKNKEIINKHYYGIMKVVKGKKVHLSCQTDKKMLLLDLDRTLIFYNDQKGFSLRPHIKRFLKSVYSHYKIYIFTAATQSYLQEMLKNMRKTQGVVQYFSGFLTRRNCLTICTKQNQEIYIKDISILKNCSPQKIVLVDDNPISYLLNPDNAIPIVPFQGETPDNHLLFLIQTLKQLKDYKDVREYIHGRYIFNKSNSNCFESIGTISTVDSLSPTKDKENIRGN